MQNAYYNASSRVGAALSPDCEKLAKPLSLVMTLLLIFTVITMLLYIAVYAYNYYKVVDPPKDTSESSTATFNDQVKKKQNIIKIGTFAAIFCSVIAVVLTVYARPNVNKALTCPANTS